MDVELKPRHRTIAANGVRLHAVEAGSEGGPVLLLLHGFPEFWYGWRKQIEPLAAAGFHVVAPDQRGYNLSDKPSRVSAYNLDTLALDVVGMIDELGAKKAFVAAHDWGGLAAWWLGVKHPDRLERLALLNAPHPAVMRRVLIESSRQRRKLSYIFLYQLPWLPERTFRRDGFAYAAKALQSTSRPGTFSDADLDLYREAWSQPGAVRSMLNWYRAGLRSQPKWPPSPRVTVPTLLLWGAKDRFLGRELAEASIDLCDDGHLEIFDEATHWIQHEEPEWVNARLVEFFG